MITAQEYYDLLYILALELFYYEKTFAKNFLGELNSYRVFDGCKKLSGKVEGVMRLVCGKCKGFFRPEDLANPYENPRCSACCVSEASASLPRCGLYRIFWKEGGYSLAAVGINSSGKYWYAPTNWISTPGWDWDIVEKIERISAT